MDKREFIQRFMIEQCNVHDNIHHQIEVALSVFNAIEETLVKSVNSTNLWDYNDKP